ncbi:transposable element Tcb2 transposase [Trichonephila clavipes]|nr:transposable element Tcb2 transposase [Trichonephila clavipes]
MIWRERGTRFESRNITERQKGECIKGSNGMGRDEVLDPYVRLFRGAVGSDFIFMDDNASCHRAMLIDDFLETENIQRMLWPANSPDLNTIEHVWDMLGKQIAAL